MTNTLRWSLMKLVSVSSLIFLKCFLIILSAQTLTCQSSAAQYFRTSIFKADVMSSLSSVLKLLRNFLLPAQAEVTCGLLNWPMAALRISGKTSEAVIRFAELVRKAWQNHDDRSTIFTLVLMGHLTIQ